MSSLRIATWNIAGGRRLLSEAHFDYSQEDLEYFADQLKSLNLDVVCLQESHTSAQDSLSKRLADALGFGYFYETPGCPSHIDPKYQLTCAILSQKELRDVKSLQLPNPQFELRFKGNGEIAQPYDRYAQIAKLDELTIVNLHTEPMGFFGRSYDSDEAKDFADQIGVFLADNVERPAVLLADFNMDEPLPLMPKVAQKLQLNDALPAGMATKPNGRQRDHMLYSPELVVANVEVVKTQTDHYLCWAELQYNDN